MKHPRTIAAAALLLAACSDNPVAPARQAPSAATGPSLSVGASSTALDFTNLTNDMVGRLLPSFDDQAAAKTIETSMIELNTHAIAGEIADAQASSQIIRSALKEGVASALLLDVMNRTLDVIDRDLAAASSTGTDLVLAN
jgi:hypothetical protein